MFYVASFPFLTSYFINSLYREYLVPVLPKYLNASFPCSLTKGNPLPLLQIGDVSTFQRSGRCFKCGIKPLLDELFSRILHNLDLFLLKDMDRRISVCVGKDGMSMACSLQCLPLERCSYGGMLG